MGVPASTLDELNGPRVLHALGALAIDLKDFIADLWKGRRPGRKGGRQRGETELQVKIERENGVNQRGKGEIAKTRKRRGDSSARQNAENK